MQIMAEPGTDYQYLLEGPVIKRCNHFLRIISTEISVFMYYYGLKIMLYGG